MKIPFYPTLLPALGLLLLLLSLLPEPEEPPHVCWTDCPAHRILTTEL